MTNGKNSAHQIDKEISTGIKKEKVSDSGRKSRTKDHIQCPHQKAVDAVIKRLNRRHWVVREGEKCRILTKTSPRHFEPHVYALTDKSYLYERYANQTCFDGVGHRSIVDLWLEHPKRRRYRGFIWSHELEEPGYFQILPRVFP